MKNRLLLFLFSLSVLAASAQDPAPLRGNQIEPGTAPGQVWMTDNSLYGAWKVPTFLQAADSSSKYVTKYRENILLGKEVVSGLFADGITTYTKQNGQSFQVAYGNYWVTSAQKGAINGVATLGADGLVPASQLPVLPGRKFWSVASQSAMLALSTASVGDQAVRTDVDKVFGLTALPASTLSNWLELPQGNGITSVNSKTGPNVNLTTNDISEGATNKYFSNALARQALSAAANTPITYNNTTGVIGMNASGITAGTYNNTTYNALGIATGGTNVDYLEAADLTGYTKTADLNIAGAVQVAWANLTGVPPTQSMRPRYTHSTGSTSSAITLTFTPLYPDELEVTKNGKDLQREEWSVTGTTFTLGITRTAADHIVVRGFSQN